MFSGAARTTPRRATRSTPRASGMAIRGRVRHRGADHQRGTFPLLAGHPDASYLQIQLGCYSGTCVARQRRQGVAGTSQRDVRRDRGRRQPPPARRDRPAGCSRRLAGRRRGRGLHRDRQRRHPQRRADRPHGAGQHARRGGRRFRCDFSRPRPCANVANGSVAPSARLPSGTRTLAVRVTDSAEATRPPPPAVGSLVGGPLNGTNASRAGACAPSSPAAARRGGPSRPAGSPRSRCTSATPRSARSAARASRSGRAGADRRALPQRRRALTDVKGRAKVTLAKGPSRELRFEYRTRVDDPTVALRARVLPRCAPARDAADPAEERGRGRADPARGRVLAPRGRGPASSSPCRRSTGAAGARSRSRARTSGSLSRAYRFTRSAGRTFRFRAHLPREGAYPYAAGNSHAVRVRVG